MTTSYGLLLYRRRSGGEQVLLAHMGGPFWARRDARAWSIPKGEAEPGEEPRQTAEREFAEEVGPAPHSPVPDLDLGSVRQRGGKTVTVFAREADFDEATARSGTFSLQWPPGSGRVQEFPEVDRVQWCTLDRARELVVSAQAEFMDRLAAALETEES